MPQQLRPSVLASFAALFAMSIAMAAPAQTAAPAGAPPAGVPAHDQGRPHHARPAPTNLQVLPKDLTGDQVIDIMRKFTGALGVECDYCHAESPTTGRLDFASDANPRKNRARVMIKMTMAINQEYLAQLTNPKPEHGVGCGTCHRGMAKPALFVPPPHERPSGPPPAAPSGPSL